VEFIASIVFKEWENEKMSSENTQTPRERRRERTKQSILLAAEALLAEGGLQNTTLANIAHRAEYSKPAIYEYFTGIEDILIELTNNGFVRLGERIQAIDPTLSPEERLLASCDAFLQFAAENGELYQLMFTHIIFTNVGLDRDWQELHKKTQVAYFAVHEIIQDGIEQGVFMARPNLDSGAMFYLCWVTLHGIASLKRELIKELGLDVDRYQATMIHLMLCNLKGTLPAE
jgi:AcrR family transcriptional regulator